MATQKQAKRTSSGQPATYTQPEQNAARTPPAIGPTISIHARPLRNPDADTRLPVSPAAERKAMVRRRKLIAAGVGLLALLLAFLLYRSLTSATPTVATPAVAPTAAPAAAIAPPAIVQPVATAPAAVIAQPIAITQPASAPAAQAAIAAPVAPAATAAPDAQAACTTIAGLPLFAGATCTEQKRDQDDGVTKLKNTYTSSATAEEIRRFYEGAFAANGWTLSKFAYDINAEQHRASIDVDTDQGPSGLITTIKLTEYLAAAPTGPNCASIAGLPAFPNATCVKSKVDQDDGVFKAEYSYSTSASPEDVRNFYATVLTQKGWTGPDFQYDLQQGLRRMQLDVETKAGAQGSFTEFQLTEK